MVSGTKDYENKTKQKHAVGSTSTCCRIDQACLNRTGLFNSVRSPEKKSRRWFSYDCCALYGNSPVGSFSPSFFKIKRIGTSDACIMQQHFVISDGEFIKDNWHWILPLLCKDLFNKQFCIYVQHKILGQATWWSLKSNLMENIRWRSVTVYYSLAFRTTFIWWFTVILWLAIIALIAKIRCRSTSIKATRFYRGAVAWQRWFSNYSLLHQQRGTCFPQRNGSEAVVNFVRVDSCTRTTTGPPKYPRAAESKMKLSSQRTASGILIWFETLLLEGTESSERFKWSSKKLAQKGVKPFTAAVSVTPPYCGVVGRILTSLANGLIYIPGWSKFICIY